MLFWLWQTLRLTCTASKGYIYRLDRWVQNGAPIGARGPGEQQDSCYDAAMLDSLQAGHKLSAACAGKPGDR